MEISTSTDTLMVVKCRPRYSSLVVSVPFFAFSVLLFMSRGVGYAYGAFVFLVGVLLLAFANRWKLTIDKQAGTVVMDMRNITGLLHRLRTVQLGDVLYVDYYFNYNVRSFGKGTLVLKLILKAGKDINFGNATIHKNKGGISTGVRYKEEDVALQVAHFLGVDCTGIPKSDIIG